MIVIVGVVGSPHLIPKKAAQNVGIGVLQAYPFERSDRRYLMHALRDLPAVQRDVLLEMLNGPKVDGVALAQRFMRATDNAIRPFEDFNIPFLSDLEISPPGTDEAEMVAIIEIAFFLGVVDKLNTAVYQILLQREVQRLKKDNAGRADLEAHARANLRIRLEDSLSANDMTDAPEDEYYLRLLINEELSGSEHKRAMDFLEVGGELYRASSMEYFSEGFVRFFDDIATSSLKKPAEMAAVIGIFVILPPPVQIAVVSSIIMLAAAKAAKSSGKAWQSDDAADRNRALLDLGALAATGSLLAPFLGGRRRLAGPAAHRMAMANKLVKFFTGEARYVRVYDEGLLHFKWHKEIKEMHSQAMPEKGVIIDLGGGTGLLTRHAARGHPDRDIHIFDLSKEMTDYALEKGVPADHIHISSATDLRMNGMPVPSNSVDGVMSNNVLYILTNEQVHAAMSETARVLKPDAVASFSSPRPAVKYDPAVQARFLREVDEQLSLAIEEGKLPPVAKPIFLEANARLMPNDVAKTRAFYEATLELLNTKPGGIHAEANASQQDVIIRIPAVIIKAHKPSPK